MKKMIVNGREISTNYGSYYPFSDGNNKKTMIMQLKNSCIETDKEMLERLVNRGYKRITFYYTTTSVKGYHDLIAFCK